VGRWKTVDHLSQNDAISVSVVICACNEAQNLEKNLPRFLTQNYRSQEILVVNDNSTDQTEQVLLAVQDPRMTFTSVIAPL
jgi:glycosyltransferase involved in cell wall biosynthesis